MWSVNFLKHILGERGMEVEKLNQVKLPHTSVKQTGARVEIHCLIGLMAI